MKTKHLRLMQRVYIMLLCMSFTSSFDESEMEGVM